MPTGRYPRWLSVPAKLPRTRITGPRELSTRTVADERLLSEDARKTLCGSDQLEDETEQQEWHAIRNPPAFGSTVLVAIDLFRGIPESNQTRLSSCSTIVNPTSTREYRPEGRSRLRVVPLPIVLDNKLDTIPGEMSNPKL